MNNVPLNTRPTTTGPILDLRLVDAAPSSVMTALISSAIEVAEESVKECYAGVRQLDPLTYRHVASRYPEGEAWRSCATPALSQLVDAIRTITRDIPEAQRDFAGTLGGEIVAVNRTAALTDDAILATSHKTAGEPT